jgi:hypothetical protein
MTMKTQWIGVGDTKILMRENDCIGDLAEWHPIAQVTKRQIYDIVEPKWYAWDLDDERALIGQFNDIGEACRVVEERLKGT